MASGLQSLASSHSPFSMGGSYGNQFPNPFEDLGSLAIPQQNFNALEWCEYIWMMQGMYRMAMERIIAYFLTSVEIGDVGDRKVGDDEKDKWLTYLNDVLNILTVIQSADRDYLCFHGDVAAVTRNGVFPLRELAGKTVDVLSQDGVYRPAEFKSFGKQELLEVTFSDGRKVLATPEHEWLVQKSTGGLIRVPTYALAGRSIPRTVAPRPPKNDDYRVGVRHGFTFGDGSLYNGGKQAVANFYGEKDREMLAYFEGVGCAPCKVPEQDLVKVHGLPPEFKKLPPNEASDSYWYGFVCGFLAADGSVDTYGCTVLTQASESVLERITAQLPRIGMTAGPVRGHYREADLSTVNGNPDAQYAGYMYYVTLLKQFMQADDILLRSHRAKFLANASDTSYGRFMRVASVRQTGIEDEVFCCVEPETHSFVIGNGVLTGNCYGNAFFSLIVPFRRHLSCPKCGTTHPLKVVYETPSFEFSWVQYQFKAKCQKCSFSGVWKIDDQPCKDESEIRYKLWSPKEIQIVHDPFTNETSYIWKIPEEYRRRIHNGDLFVLERASQEVIKAIKNNYLFKFAPDVLYHMKEPSLSGVYNRGWGISRTLTNFRQVWYVQVLQRYNEAIAMDYVVPFRLITPVPRGGSGAADATTIDPLLSVNMGDFMSQVRAMIRRRRRDPASWFTLPFPVQYQALGGDATQLAPRELLDQGMEFLLSSAGAPIELFKGSLSVQAFPAAARIFESTWKMLVVANNTLLRWIINQTAQIMSWEPVSATLLPVTIADDMARNMAILQLAMGQAASATTGLRTLGLNWKDEQRRLADEARFQTELQADLQEEMAQADFGQQIAKAQFGQMGPGGAMGGGMGAAGPQQGGAPQQTVADPTAGGQAPGPVTSYLQGMSPNASVTPNELLETAQSLAMQLQSAPASQRRSELAALKQKNEVLWSLVKSKLQETRNDARSVGQAQVLAQSGMSP